MVGTHSPAPFTHATPPSHTAVAPRRAQEEGNIPYVIDNRVGAFETKPRKIAAILRGWLLGEGREEFEGMAPRSKALGRWAEGWRASVPGLDPGVPFGAGRVGSAV